MPRIPFSVYDFFGYLAAGVLLCAAADYALPGDWILKERQPAAEVLFWVVTAYIVGHVNANVSSWLFERLIVGRLLGSVTDNLFGVPDRRGWLFPGYYTPLDASVQKRVRARVTGTHEALTGEALFHHVRTTVKRDRVTWEQMQVFLQLYGFCRNVSFALLAVSVLLVVHGSFGFALMSLIAAICMFYRYLKFYRQYAFEMFTAYPDLPDKPCLPTKEEDDQ